MASVAKEKLDRSKPHVNIGMMFGKYALMDNAPEEMSASPEISVESVVDRAIEVMGDRDDAMRWLGAPISLLGTSEGATRVEDVLGRMERGVW